MKLKARTLKIFDDGTYEAILEFYRDSYTSVTGQAAIRSLIHFYGKKCREKLENGLTAQAADVEELEEFANGFFEETA
jgi:hypothetical protein